MDCGLDFTEYTGGVFISILRLHHNSDPQKWFRICWHLDLVGCLDHLYMPIVTILKPPVMILIASKSNSEA